MDKQKIILLFSDLEGTILKEELGTYSAEDMYHFLEQIDKLQTITGANVRMHLVSPVYISKMQEVMGKIDKNISSYNRINKDHKGISYIEGAGAFEDDNDFQGKPDERILPMKKPIDSKRFDVDRYGKEKYVKNWCEIYNESQMKELIMCIYCGNGRNDLDAISYINCQKNGFVVCPKNTRTGIKEKAFYVSEKEDLIGVTEGIGAIYKEIEKRVNPEESLDEERKVEGEEK